MNNYLTLSRIKLSEIYEQLNQNEKAIQVLEKKDDLRL
jgi:hypothetical protein